MKATYIFTNKQLSIRADDMEQSDLFNLSAPKFHISKTTLEKSCHHDAICRSKIYLNRNGKIQFVDHYSVNVHLKPCLCHAKLWRNADFAPKNYGAMQTLPRKIMEPSYFAPRNYGAMQTLPRKITETQLQGLT